MPVEFIGKIIEVELGEGETPSPVAFRLGKKEHRVAEVLQRWEELGSGQQIPGHQERRGQGQRVHYRVRTSEGEVYELYVDWQAARRLGRRRQEKRRWFAHRRIS
jgi:hypothetical protein